MRISEQLGQMEERIRKLEAIVEELKAWRPTVTLEGEPIGKAAPAKKTGGATGTRAKKTTGKQ